MIRTRVRFLVFVLSILLLLLCSSSCFAQVPVEPLHHEFKIFGGLSLPMGDFASTSTAQGGFAKAGLGGGAEFNTEVVKSFELGLMGALNLNDADQAEVERQFQSRYSGSSVKSGAWWLLDFMGNAGFVMPASPEVSIYGKMYVGALIGNAPEITITVGSVTARQASSTAAALAYGFGGGMMISHTVDVGVRFLTGEPEYETTINSGITGSSSNSTPVKFKQPSGILQLDIGYVFN